MKHKAQTELNIFKFQYNRMNLDGSHMDPQKREPIANTKQSKTFITPQTENIECLKNTHYIN